jgi:hypothetical protein
VIYGVRLTNYIYSYNNYILNLVGRSIGKFFRSRLVAATADFVFNRWDLEILPYSVCRGGKTEDQGGVGIRIGKGIPKDG